MSFQADAFQNDAFQVEVVAVAAGAGGWIVKHRAGDELRHTGASFSRKRWLELLVQIEQEREAVAVKATGIRKPAARKAIRGAAALAEEAIEAARAGAASAKAAANLRAMASALEAAAGAKSLVTIIAQAEQARALACAILAAMQVGTDDEDEEDAIMALLAA